MVALISAPLSGWLADTKFGNYKMFKFGAVLLFVSTVMNCLLLILNLESSHVLNGIHLGQASSLFVVGACASVTTALPLGLNRMPDASSSSIASYIAWFVFDILGKGMNLLISECMDEKISLTYHLLLGLFPAICMSVAVSSKFFFSPKWLIIEPKSPQSLKTIYQVLKFAAKHKAPLNRSAFTYWEKDIPSRIDLGKSKYGGPFITEQVENVKKTLRLLTISVTLLFCGFSIFFPTNFYYESFQYTTNCENEVLHFLIRNVRVYGVLGILANEFLVYPL